MKIKSLERLRRPRTFAAARKMREESGEKKAPVPQTAVKVK